MAKAYETRIVAAPKPGNFYWCDLHDEKHIHIPEFWKTRPVLIISRNNYLRGKVSLLPVTTDSDNENYPNSIELSAEICKKIGWKNVKRCWVVCDHIMTLATSRLSHINRTPPKIAKEEFDAILKKAHFHLAGWNLMQP